MIYRIDPATARIVATIPTPGTTNMSHIVTGAGAVWATSEAARSGVYRIDPRHNRVASFIRVQPVPMGITVGYGRVWVTEPREGPGIVRRIGPGTNRVSGPSIRVGVGAGWIVPGAGAVWVTNGDGDGSVSRIDPATGVVTRTLANLPDVTAVGAGSLWVTPNSGGIRASIPPPDG